MTKPRTNAKIWTKPQLRALGTLGDVAGDAESGNEAIGCSLKKNGTVVCS